MVSRDWPGVPVTRSDVASAANDAAQQSRSPGAPVLTPESSRDALIAWLQWCDPNGSHTDDLAGLDDCEPYDLGGAWEAVESMLDQ